MPTNLIFPMKITFEPCDETWTFSDYTSFYSSVVEKEEGAININSSFAVIDGKKIRIGGDREHNVVLIRKEEHERLKQEFPKEDFSWWSKDGLYYKTKNIFPGSILTLHYKENSVIVRETSASD